MAQRDSKVIDAGDQGMATTIQALPPEILHQCFQLLLNDALIDDHQESWILSLRLVCHLWCEVLGQGFGGNREALQLRLLFRHHVIMLQNIDTSQENPDFFLGGFEFYCDVCEETLMLQPPESADTDDDDDGDNLAQKGNHHHVEPWWQKLRHTYLAPGVGNDWRDLCLTCAERKEHGGLKGLRARGYYQMNTAFTHDQGISSIRDCVWICYGSERDSLAFATHVAIPQHRYAIPPGVPPSVLTMSGARWWTSLIQAALQDDHTGLFCGWYALEVPRNATSFPDRDHGRIFWPWNPRS